jgi:hypothetical protein
MLPQVMTPQLVFTFGQKSTKNDWRLLSLAADLQTP